MIKFDFTSHFIIEFNGIILDSTLLIIIFSVNSKWVRGLLCNLAKGFQSMRYATGGTVAGVHCIITEHRTQ